MRYRRHSYLCPLPHSISHCFQLNTRWNETEGLNECNVWAHCRLHYLIVYCSWDIPHIPQAYFDEMVLEDAVVVMHTEWIKFFSNEDREFRRLLGAQQLVSENGRVDIVRIFSIPLVADLSRTFEGGGRRNEETGRRR